MTKDVYPQRGGTQKGLNRLRTIALCFSFQKVALHPVVWLIINIVVFVVLAFSTTMGHTKVLRTRKWVSLTENSATNAWNLNFNNGNFNNNNKTNENSVRPVSAFDGKYKYVLLNI
jgi:hypothetical protein